MNEKDWILLTSYIDRNSLITDKVDLELSGVEVRVQNENVIDQDPLVAAAVGGYKLWINRDHFIKAAEVLRKSGRELNIKSLEELQAEDAAELKRVKRTVVIGGLVVLVVVLLAILFLTLVD